jgi:asparagine synthase (glutamine-hydrolysing)
LRSSLSSHLPAERIQAAKQGFSAPDSSWFKGESLEFVKSLLNKNAQIYEFLDYKAISSLVQKHFDGKENRRLLIWSLIYFETWLSQQ